MKKSKPAATGGVKEIARRAKVSIATVDRVIHQRPGVSEKTRARINEIILELNYQPNVLAQRLALGSRGTIKLAVLIPAVSPETEFWQGPLEGVNQAESEIKPYGIQVTHFFFDQNDPQSFTKQLRKIEAHQPDGVLFIPLFVEESIRLIKFCERSSIPYVLINADIPDYDRQCYIGPESYHSGYLAGQLVHYCTRNKQKVVLVNIARMPGTHQNILRREVGFRAYFRDHELKHPIIPLHTKQTDYAAVAQQLTQLVKKEKQIGAIFVTNSRVSLVARWLEKARLEEVMLVGYDFLKANVEYLQKEWIDFLICEKPQEQAYRGIMTLFQHLVYATPVVKTHYMPIDIVTKANSRFYGNYLSVST